jgi:hypothetical protein
MGGHQHYRIAFRASAVVFGCLFSGCAATTSASDILTQGALEKSKSGVAILKAEILGHGCTGGTITLATKRGQTFDAVQTLQTIGASPAITSDVMSIELPPNEYHVVNVACQMQSGRTRTTISLGKRDGGVLGFGGEFKSSYASFRIATGEIVNLGALTVMSGFLGSAHLSVTDLPTNSLDRFRKEKPNLAKEMVTRHLVVSRPPLSPEETRKLCDSYAVLKGVLPALGASMPPECQPASATSASATPSRPPKPQ